MPVQYVQKGTGPDGLQEGWVGSPFNALVVGFGQTGREALGFLYEQGAFVGKDFSKSPFHCTVAAPGPFEDYRRSFPGLDGAAGVEYVGCEAGSDIFWQTVGRLMPSLNYIVIDRKEHTSELQSPSSISYAVF